MKAKLLYSGDLINLKSTTNPFEIWDKPGFGLAEILSILDTNFKHMCLVLSTKEMNVGDCDYKNQLSQQWICVMTSDGSAGWAIVYDEEIEVIATNNPDVFR